MKLTFLGGAMEVGASSILVKLNNHNILLDSGIRQKKSKDQLPDFNLIHSFGGVEAIIISHAHMDHIGSLPFISKEYPDAKIFMNRMTFELSRVLLYDSLKIMNYQEGEIPIFNEDDVLNMLDRVELVPFQKEITILNDIQLTFYMAGHIAGASCCYLKSKEGTIFYTGDFSLFPQHAIAGLSIPKLRPDVVISESTYGDRLHANRESEEMRLIDTVQETISNGGKVLIPVFALGRSQEVLLILKKAFHKKQIVKVPVYVDGMVRNINTVFLNNPLFLKESLGKRILRGNDIFYNEQIIKVEDEAMRKKIVDEKGPCIVVASSGMLTGGMSEYYASYFVQDSKNAIILTGYQDEESNGSTLMKLLDLKEEERKLKLNEKVYAVLCQIHKVGLSAHADKQEMKNLFSLLKPKHIILGHGEEGVIDSLAVEITKELHTDVYAPRIGDVLELEIRNPRKQIDYKLEYLYGGAGDLEQFYYFIQEHYGNKPFTAEDLFYIYHGQIGKEEEVANFTKELIESPYFSQDRRRYFLFRISDELELQEILNKEITTQDLEEVIERMMKKFPYRKISYYLNEKRIILTFDFPRVVGEEFDKMALEFLRETGFQIEKNENINNLACENAIKEIVGNENIDKISYLPTEDKFKVKVYSFGAEDAMQILKKTGYQVEFVIVAKNSNKETGEVLITGNKLEQNEALLYITKYFQEKEHKPYKKSLKNGKFILSFITYEIGCLYLKELEAISKDIGWEIELNHNANMNMIFQELERLLIKYEIEKIKNPSYLPLENKVSVKLPIIEEEKIQLLKEEFLEVVGLELIIS